MNHAFAQAGINEAVPCSGDGQHKTPEDYTAFMALLKYC
jgi:hypothetical protein